MLCSKEAPVVLGQAVMPLLLGRLPALLCSSLSCLCSHLAFLSTLCLTCTRVKRPSHTPCS